MRTPCTAASCSKSLSTSSTRTGARCASAKWILQERGIKTPPKNHPQNWGSPQSHSPGCQARIGTHSVVLSTSQCWCWAWSCCRYPSWIPPSSLLARRRSRSRHVWADNEGWRWRNGRITGCRDMGGQWERRDVGIRWSSTLGDAAAPLSPKPTPESTAKLPPAFPWEEKQALLLQGGDFW